MLLRKCKRENLLIPNVAKHANGGEDGVGYEGATVIEPKRAFYEEPVATLDFASLYPSIMQAYNLCYSTLLTPSQLEGLTKSGKLTADQYAVAPTEGKDTFVNATTRKGILPQILDELLAARKRAKKDMKAATDPMEYAVQNGRQLALKVCQSVSRCGEWAHHGVSHGVSHGRRQVGRWGGAAVRRMGGAAVRRSDAAQQCGMRPGFCPGLRFVLCPWSLVDLPTWRPLLPWLSL